MAIEGLRGVIAAVVTPIDTNGEPDYVRLVAHARGLLDEGCDGINLLGTTGEATSLTAEQRRNVMRAVASSGLPLARFMVGTGAAALGDTVALTRAAAELGFAGALLLPPFYYKPVPDAGLVDYIGAVVASSADPGVPIYLYNFPALSGITYGPGLTAELLSRFGSRIAGLKDSSGDLEYAGSIAALSPAFSIFPSNEAVLLRARAGDFAGCISATANVNARHCAAAYRDGNAAALGKASTIRAAFDGTALVPAVKAVVAHLRGDAGFAPVLPPLRETSPEELEIVLAKIADVSDRT